MSRTATTLVFMTFVPALLLLVYMHIYSNVVGPPWRAGWLTIVMMGVAVATGVAAVAASGWSRRTKVWVAAIYAAAAVPLMPVLALLAQCTTGDRI